ncbi:class I SAM-dependent methyltransferase [Pseudomonas aeruginosa]|uniref:class I SAM-dependent methyltransferase n=1 Tax=Pseudomonas aeruginosa TaxID=287 RepID=UPI003D02E17A
MGDPGRAGAADRLHHPLPARMAGQHGHRQLPGLRSAEQELSVAGRVRPGARRRGLALFRRRDHPVERALREHGAEDHRGLPLRRRLPRGILPAGNLGRHGAHDHALVQALPRAALDSFAGWRQGKAPGGWQRARFRLRQRAGRDHDGQGVPRAQVYGCDFHAPSIERARANAEAAGVGDRVRFEVSDSDALAGKKFDFVTTFVVIHDATDPQQMMKDLRESTADDGTYLMVELNLSQELHENMNLFGRVMYPQSTLYCMTCSLSHGGEGLGAFMGEDRARQMAEAAGFSRFRKVPSEWPPLPALFELRP